MTPGVSTSHRRVTGGLSLHPEFPRYPGASLGQIQPLAGDLLPLWSEIIHIDTCNLASTQQMPNVIKIITSHYNLHH